MVALRNAHSQGESGGEVDFIIYFPNAESLSLYRIQPSVIHKVGFRLLVHKSHQLAPANRANSP